MENYRQEKSKYYGVFSSPEEAAVHYAGIVPRPGIPRILRKMNGHDLKEWQIKHPVAGMRIRRRIQTYKRLVKNVALRLQENPGSRLILRELIDRMDRS